MPDDAAITQPAESASPEPAASSSDSATTSSSPGHSAGSFEDFLFRALPDLPIGSDGQSALSEDDEPAETPQATATDAESAPESAGSVPPSEDAGETTQEGSRRKNLGAEKDAEIARLVAERDAAIEQARAEARQQIIAEQQAERDRAASERMTTDQRAEAERFDAACRMADTDPRLAEPVPGDLQGRNLYQWREDRKDLVARYPEAEAALRADLTRALDAERAGMQVQVEAVKSGLREQIGASAVEMGIDPESWKKPGTTWLSMARDIGNARFEAGKAEATAALTAERDQAVAESARLAKENEDLRGQALSSVKAPAPVGRSASTATDRRTADPNASWEANLALGLGFPT